MITLAASASITALANTVFQSSSVCGLYSCTPVASVTVATEPKTIVDEGTIIEFMTSLYFAFGDIPLSGGCPFPAALIAGGRGAGHGVAGAAGCADVSADCCAVTTPPRNSARVTSRNQWNVRIV